MPQAQKSQKSGGHCGIGTLSCCLDHGCTPGAHNSELEGLCSILHFLTPAFVLWARGGRLGSQPTGLQMRVAEPYLHLPLVPFQILLPTAKKLAPCLPLSQVT